MANKCRKYTTVVVEGKKLIKLWNFIFPTSGLLTDQK